MPLGSWRGALRAIGAGFVGVGAVQIAYALSGLRFGDAEWELAAFGQLSATLAVFAIGFAGLTLYGFLAPSRAAVMTGGVLGIFCGVLTGFGAVVTLLNLPLVWRAELPNAVGWEFRTGVMKTAVLCSAYGVGLLAISAKSLMVAVRSTRRG